jgi:hypothetical protein
LQRLRLFTFGAFVVHLDKPPGASSVGVYESLIQ